MALAPRRRGCLSQTSWRSLRWLQDPSSAMLHQMAAAPHTHAAREESTQGPNATASHSCVCLLQISRDILAIAVTERWEDDFWLNFCSGGGVCALRAHALTHSHALFWRTEQLHILIKILFGLSCWHLPLIVCNWVSPLTWIINSAPILSACGVWSSDWALCWQLPPFCSLDFFFEGGSIVSLNLCRVNLKWFLIFFFF